MAETNRYCSRSMNGGLKTGAEPIGVGTGFAYSFLQAIFVP
jgi:hypothetical protein